MKIGKFLLSIFVKQYCSPFCIHVNVDMHSLIFCLNIGTFLLV